MLLLLPNRFLTVCAVNVQACANSNTLIPRCLQMEF